MHKPFLFLSNQSIRLMVSPFLQKISNLKIYVIFCLLIDGSVILLGKVIYLSNTLKRKTS